MGCHSLLQGIFPTQGLNQGLLHCRQMLHQLSYQGSPWEDVSWPCFLARVLSFFSSAVSTVCMVKPLKMAVLLLFARPLMDKNLLHWHPMYMTDLPTYLPQVPSKDCFSFISEHLHYVGFPGGASGKEPICQCRLDVRDPGSIPVLGRPPEEGMTTHYSILAWRIQWTEEPVGLQSIGSHSWTRLKHQSVHAQTQTHTQTHTSPPHSLSKGPWRTSLQLVSLVTKEPTWHRFPLKPPPAPRSQDCHHVLPHYPLHTTGVSVGRCFIYESLPPSPQLLNHGCLHHWL